MPDPLGDISYTWPFFVAALLGYLLGSVPFGVVLTRLAGLGDVRNIGSGNIGATNVLRTGNKGLAAATLLLDGGKGLAAALIGKSFGPDMMVLAAGGAFLGHLYPVWLKFRGGKGVATFMGVMLGVDVLVGLACCATWLAVAALFRISSLAALAAVLAGPIYAYLLVDLQVAELALFFLVLIAFSHRENIARLARGAEPHIGQK
ncbi:MAG: glycerol-3-phosphate 1-O-acyltransferase PlsY [Sphingomonadales bacterium]